MPGISQYSEREMPSQLIVQGDDSFTHAHADTPLHPLSSRRPPNPNHQERLGGGRLEVRKIAKIHGEGPMRVADLATMAERDMEQVVGGLIQRGEVQVRRVPIAQFIACMERAWALCRGEEVDAFGGSSSARGVGDSDDGEWWMGGEYRAG